MDGLSILPPARFAAALVLLTVVGGAAVALAGTTAHDRAAEAGPLVLEAAHLPPLLTIPGERVRLRFDAFCVGAEAASDEVGCEPTGSVFVRPQPAREVTEIPLRWETSAGERYLAADVPVEVSSAAAGFSYHAELRVGEVRALLPPGDTAAPFVSAPLEPATHVDLGMHHFGSPRRADERVARAAWGSGSTDVGLEQGRDAMPIGATAFDVDASGAVYLLDEAHHRLLVWRRSGERPSPVPVAVAGTIADMAVSGDGSVYVLETVAGPDMQPVVRRFDGDGRELEAIEIAERSASQIRLGPDGPLVLQQPAQQWMPLMPGGVPATKHDQVRAGRAARPVRGGSELTLLRTGNEIRVALDGPAGAHRAWRISSASDLAEVQLAEPLGDRLVLVVRVYADGRDEFVVLVLDRAGVVRRFAVAPQDWAEAAPLGRFRLVGTSLYQLGSAPTGAFVDRFTLGARP